MSIKNIVFDVGNVLVRYDPDFIITKAFPWHPNRQELVQNIFKHETWFALNRGQLTESQALQEYSERLGLEIEQLVSMARITKESLTPIPESIELLKRLHWGYRLYALTDNTHEIMAYLRMRYDFWSLFRGVVVSSHIGHLKPEPEIFNHLLQTYQLNPKETLFLDDILHNVQGAKNLGFQALLFENTEKLIKEMKEMGIIL